MNIINPYTYKFNNCTMESPTKSNTQEKIVKAEETKKEDEKDDIYNTWIDSMVERFGKDNKDSTLTIVFDMDHTACGMHSRGVLERKYLQKYIDSISPDFKNIVPVLFKRGVHLAIASFTDVSYLNMPTTSPRKHIAGQELVHRFLYGNFPREIVQSFCIATGNSDMFKATWGLKKLPHMEYISRWHGVKLKNMVIFDDSIANFDKAKEHEYTCIYTPTIDGKGFKLTDYQK